MEPFVRKSIFTFPKYHKDHQDDVEQQQQRVVGGYRQSQHIPCASPVGNVPSITRDAITQPIMVDRVDFEMFFKNKSTKNAVDNLSPVRSSNHSRYNKKSARRPKTKKQEMPVLEDLLTKIERFRLPTSYNPYQHNMGATRDVISKLRHHHPLKQEESVSEHAHLHAKTLELDQKKHQKWGWREQWDEWSDRRHEEDIKRVVQDREAERTMWIDTQERLIRLRQSAAQIGEVHYELTDDAEMHKEIMHTRLMDRKHYKLESNHPPASAYRLGLDVPRRSYREYTGADEEVSKYVHRDGLTLQELNKVENQAEEALAQVIVDFLSPDHHLARNKLTRQSPHPPGGRRSRSRSRSKSRSRRNSANYITADVHPTDSAPMNKVCMTPEMENEVYDNVVAPLPRSEKFRLARRRSATLRRLRDIKKDFTTQEDLKRINEALAEQGFIVSTSALANALLPPDVRIINKNKHLPETLNGLVRLPVFFDKRNANTLLGMTDGSSGPTELDVDESIPETDVNFAAVNKLMADAALKRVCTSVILQDKPHIQNIYICITCDELKNEKRQLQYNARQQRKRDEEKKVAETKKQQAETKTTKDEIPLEVVDSGGATTSEKEEEKEESLTSAELVENLLHGEEDTNSGDSDDDDDEDLFRLKEYYLCFMCKNFCHRSGHNVEFRGRFMASCVCESNRCRRDVVMPLSSQEIDEFNRKNKTRHWAGPEPTSTMNHANPFQSVKNVTIKFQSVWEELSFSDLIPRLGAQRDVRGVLEKYFEQIRHIFSFHAAAAGNTMKGQFGFLTATTFIHYCHTTRLVDDVCTVTQLDGIFGKSNSVVSKEVAKGDHWTPRSSFETVDKATKGSLENPDNLFILPQFLQALVRIALKKFEFRRYQGKPTSELSKMTPHAKLSKLLLEHILPYSFPALDAVFIARRNFRVPPMQVVFERHLKPLWRLFTYFALEVDSALKSNRGERADILYEKDMRVKLDHFLEMLIKSKMLGIDGISRRQALVCFVLSLKQVSFSLHNTLDFAGFTECIARTAHVMHSREEQAKLVDTMTRKKKVDADLLFDYYYMPSFYTGRDLEGLLAYATSLDHFCRRLGAISLEGDGKRKRRLTIMAQKRQSISIASKGPERGKLRGKRNQLPIKRGISLLPSLTTTIAEESSTDSEQSEEKEEESQFVAYNVKA